MKRFISLTTLALTLAMGALLGMSSCVNDNYDDLPEPDLPGNGRTNVVFTIKAGNPKTRANSTWVNPDSEVSGNNIENTINSMTLAIYDTDNKFVGTVSNLVMLQQGDDGSRKYVGQLPVKTNGTDIIEEGKQYKVMLFANYIPTENQLASPAEMTFGRPNPPTKEIAMWGVKSSVVFTLDKEVAQDLGRIDLLRAMAKVEVRLSQDLRDKGYSLTGPYIDNANLSGYLLPSGWNTASATADILPQNALRELKATTYQIIDMTYFSADEYWRAYMPEISSTEGSRPSVSLRIMKESNQVAQYSLQFADYDATTGQLVPDSYRDIVRNHIYRYEIKGIGAEAEVTLNVDPWLDNNTEEWDYSNTVGVNDTERLSWTANTYTSISEARLIMLDDYQIPAECTFRIASPAGAEWTAYLIPANADTSREDFTFVDADGNDLSDAQRPSGIIETEGPMQTLRIRPTKPKGDVTREVILHVEVRLGDNDVITANLLGGKYGDGNNEFTLIQNQQ